MKINTRSTNVSIILEIGHMNYNKGNNIYLQCQLRRPQCTHMQQYPYYIMKNLNLLIKIRLDSTKFNLEIPISVNVKLFRLVNQF